MKVSCIFTKLLVKRVEVFFNFDQQIFVVTCEGTVGQEKAKILTFFPLKD